MGSLGGDEECGFFDAHGNIDSVPGASSSFSEISDENFSYNHWNENGFPYGVWICSPKSVNERRSKFLDWMGVSLDSQVCFEEDEAKRGDDEVRDASGAVLRTLGLEERFYSTRTSISCWSNDNSDLSEEPTLQRDSTRREGNLEGETVCSVSEKEKDENKTEVSEHLVTSEEVESAYVSSPSCQPFMEKEAEERNKSDGAGISGGFGSTSVSSPSSQPVVKKVVEKQNKSAGTGKKIKNRWLSKLRSIACIENRWGEVDGLRSSYDDSGLGPRVRRVKVRQYGKRSKELSAVYRGQDFQAHGGSILAMKFSPDGQYLASAGEDGVVRVWQVVEDERCDDSDIPEIDPSCIYFTVNQLSELKPLFMDEKEGKMRSLRKTYDSACVIFPPKVFRILERPLHEFHGHSGEILDLSWSKNNYLLSSSVDKSVRMWQIGCQHCLRVFSHSNYVTCVQFNPVDNNYFISGSIDGKVRIWSVSRCQVVDWTDTRDVVTAVCYRPDGQGGIIGSMSGDCRFYNMSDNQLQLDAQICLNGKRKPSYRRIIGFQFCPQDSSKIMVTCADSQVRILQGRNVICKYKGLRNAGNQMPASFSSDGKHIISACDDSNVYVWNFDGQDEPAVPNAKNIRSCERFAANASIAIPWEGLKNGDPDNGRQFPAVDHNLQEKLPFSSSKFFSLSHEYMLESFPKGSATWPEEKLPASNPMSMSSAMHKSQYKFLKTSCQSTANSHAWGLIIVTAGWDGRIRSFLNYGLPVPV